MIKASRTGMLTHKRSIRMKFIKKLFIVALALIVVSSCEMTDLDLQDNPNRVPPESANVNDLYNAIQLNVQALVEDTWYATGSMARMVANINSYNYINAFTPEALDDVWNEAYAQIFPDIAALIPLAEERGLDIHAGSAKVLKAYILMVLVDLFGDVPNSEALRGTEVISPAADPGANVYADAVRLLDEAIAQISGTDASAPAFDNFYGGDAAKWVTLAKTLKLRAAINTRLVNSNAAADVAALLADGDLIDEEAEDFQFNYSNNRVLPDSRHPLYANHYEAADGDYVGNYFMWLLRAEKQDANGNAYTDPRLRYYFYRQVESSVDGTINDYSCHFSNFPTQEDQPAHYATVDPRIPYCVAAADGYWGRDHLNAEGIPPDGNLRTRYGLYPAAGQFDDNSFNTTQQLGTTGGLGAGIEPLMLASFVDFLRAEAALTLSTGEDARALLESGIRKSMEKVIGFSDLVPGTFAREVDNRGDVSTVEELYKPTDKDIDDYVSLVLSNYDAADDKLDVVMKEYLIALWGNGVEAYNMYRRTGKPNNMAPALEPNNEDFINTFFLPADHVNLNQNASQKEHTVRVFWAEGGPQVY